MKANLKSVDPKPAKDGKNEFEEYHVDDAVRDLLRAEEHKQNPKLMDKVHAKLGKKKKAISSIQELKQRKAELDTDEIN